MGVRGLLPIHTLTVSDDQNWRSAMRMILLSDRAYHLVGEATCGLECIETCSEFMPDLVLLGPMLSEEDFLENVASEFPSIEVKWVEELRI